MNDQTRRNWLVSIGQAAVTLGVTGTARDATIGTPALPPGVYEPSTDHLSHALMSAERYHPIPAGSPTDYIRPADGPFKPLFFSAAEFPVILRITQLLLGTASEERALSQEVAEWIDLRLSSVADFREAWKHVDPLHRSLAVAYFGHAQQERDAKADPAGTCRDGLGWISSEARSGYSKEFLLLPEEQQIALLQSISDERPDKQMENAGTRLFAFLKAETVRGFYTSRAGLKELDFKGNAFYARSPGCESRPS